MHSSTLFQWIAQLPQQGPVYKVVLCSRINLNVTFNQMLLLGIPTYQPATWLPFEKILPIIVCVVNVNGATSHKRSFLIVYGRYVILQTQKALDCSQVLTSLHTYSKYCTFT